MNPTRDERRAAIAREHAAIGRAIGEIESELDWLRAHPLPCGATWDLARVVGSFRDHLLAHFDFEEHGGPLDPELLHDAFLSSEAAALTSEHRVFTERLEHLRAKLGDTSPHPSQLATLDRELRNLIADLRLHEATETRLMLRL